MIVDKDDILYIIDWQSPITTHITADIGQFFRYDDMFGQEDKALFMIGYNDFSNVKMSYSDFMHSDFRDLVNYLQLLQNCDERPNLKEDVLGLIDNFIMKYK